MLSKHFKNEDVRLSWVFSGFLEENFLKNNKVFIKARLCLPEISRPISGHKKNNKFIKGRLGSPEALFGVSGYNKNSVKLKGSLGPEIQKYNINFHILEANFSSLWSENL